MPDNPEGEAGAAAGLPAPTLVLTLPSGIVREVYDRADGLQIRLDILRYLDDDGAEMMPPSAAVGVVERGFVFWSEYDTLPAARARAAERWAEGG